MFDFQLSYNPFRLDMADFFCGVEGFRKGFELTGENVQCVFSNDVDKNCQKTYTLNFSPFTLEDIRNIEEFPNFDLLIGGFPCQSFSIAGNRKGLEDDRGKLIFEICRALKGKNPRAFLLENVKHLLTHNKGETFRTILKEFEKLGYFTKYKVLNSLRYGNTPQNRERLFIVGFKEKNDHNKFTFPHPIKLTRKITDLLEEKIPNKYYYTQSSAIYPKLIETVKKYNTVYQYRRYYVRENKSGVCPTLTANMGSGGHNVPIILDNTGRIRKLTPRECFNLQGFMDFKLPNISDSHLYKQAGNSVNVVVVKRIAEQLIKVLKLSV